MEFVLNPLVTGLELGGPGAGLVGSPARSWGVFLFKPPGGGGNIFAVIPALLADTVISVIFLGEGMRLGCRRCEVNYVPLDYCLSSVKSCLTEFSMLSMVMVNQK